MKRKSIILILSLVAFFLNQERVCAYSTGVHRRITERVIDRNLGELNKYINDYIGLASVTVQVDKKEIRKWIEDGSVWEDISFNPWELLTSHYHNPITNKGLTKGGVTIGESAYDRANKPTNDWSWQKARENLHKGLTLLTKTEREKALAKSFKALGHLVHLVQDMSVPAHTRDDMHVPNVDGDPYEAYTDNKRKTLNYTAEPFLYWNVSISPYAPKHFWDTDTYNGSNPYSSGYIGLSEYTNANFFSKATIFKNFPHPAKENTDYNDFSSLPIVVITTPDNITHETLYIKEKVSERLLAGLTYFADELWNSAGLPETKKYGLTLHLDNRCHVGYASALIPRAVGYSVGLLDYFFRGQLRVTSMPVIEGNRIRSVKVKIKNTTTNETMSDGQFTLTYSYRPTGGNSDGSQDIWGQAPVVASGNFAYGEERLFEFSLPNPTQIPVENASSAKFTLAFKGTLGVEQGAVIGKAFSLGEIKFNEDWDNGLNGNHNWAHTDFNYFDQDPTYGISSNVIESGVLVKDNIKYTNNPWPHTNDSFISCRVNNDQFSGSRGHIFICHYFLDKDAYKCMVYLWPGRSGSTTRIRFTTCCPVEMKEGKSFGMRKIMLDFLIRLARWSNDSNWRSMPMSS